MFYVHYHIMTVLYTYQCSILWLLITNKKVFEVSVAIVFLIIIQGKVSFLQNGNRNQPSIELRQYRGKALDYKCTIPC